MDNIYNILPNLKNRVDLFSSYRYFRYVIVFLYRDKPRYFFELDDTYLDYMSLASEFDFLIAYRKSGKLVSYAYSSKKIDEINKRGL